MNSTKARSIWPDTFLIGAAKSATTSIARALGRHPQLFAPVVKEPRYFAFPSRPCYSGPGDADFLDQVFWSRDAYLDLYCKAHNDARRLDASALYLTLSDSATRIHSAIPQAYIMAVLRNPVDRAYSQYLMNVREGLETRDFLTALQEETDVKARGWSPTWWYVERGRYTAQLRAYEGLFPQDQIRVWLFDEWAGDPHAVLRQMAEFLNIDPSHSFGRIPQENISGIPRFPRAQYLITGPTALRRLGERILPRFVATHLWKWFSGKNLRRPPMPEAAREWLHHQFREEIQTLSRHLHRDLTSWLSC